MNVRKANQLFKVIKCPNVINWFRNFSINDFWASDYSANLF